MEEQYVQYQGHNDSKNVFKAARTPSVLLSVSLVFYILSGVSDLTRSSNTDRVLGLFGSLGGEWKIQP